MRTENNLGMGKFENRTNKRTESVKAPQSRKNLIVE